jgi:hypothetical protein
MKKGTIFPLAEYGSLAPNPPTPPQFFEATGEVRDIKAGEWFVSGAIPEVYYATHNMKGQFHIATPRNLR